MKILLIDDDVHLTDTINFLLLSKGYSDIDIINKSHEIMNSISKIRNYDCIILDLMMRKPDDLNIQESKETGEALYELIRLKNKNIPIIIITGKDIQKLKINFEKDNTQIIFKPFHPRLHDLIEALENVI